MAHRITALAGLLLLWSTPAARAFQGPAAIAAVRVPAAPAAIAMSSLPPSPRAPSATWAWSSGSQGGRPGGRKDRRAGLVPQPLRANAAADEAAADAGGGSAAETRQPSDTTAIVKVEDSGGPLKRGWRRIMRFMSGGKEIPSVKELGLYALLSYGFVSNASYSICVGLSWFTASKKTGLSPLAPDQWPVFMLSFAALFAVNNILRVPRLALSISLAPAFDRLIAFLMKKTGRRKGFATGLCVFLVNIMGTIVLMATGIVLASICSGVPFWPTAAAP